MSKALGCKIWMGGGSSNPSGLALQESYQEAVVALQVAVARDQRIVFYPDIDRSNLGATSLRRKISTLTHAMLDEGRASATRYRTRFVQEVLIGTGGRPETTRRAFIEALHRLLEALEGRKTVSGSDLAEFESEVTLKLDSALNLNEMVGRFETGMEMLLAFLEQPMAGEKFFRLRKAQEAILGSLQQPWSLPGAARQFGFSTTSFSREFKHFSGLPFSAFLLAKRIEKAKRLLAQSPMSVSQVAEACGFRSANYFLQIFKKKVGRPPGQMRS